MEQLINSLNGIIWNPALVYLCLAAGLFYTIKTRFMQIRYLKEMLRLIFSGSSSKNGISSYQALAVSIAARVGIGNIVGVSAAIGFGGPGAIFWMWVVSILGASTAYIESTLGQIYKESEKPTGQYRGGPAYYFEKCLQQKWYAIVFAVASIVACGLFFPGLQANGVINAITQVVGEGDIIHITYLGDVGTNRIIGIIVILFVLGFIIFGGIKRIAVVAQYIAPFMALAYILMSIVVVFANIEMIPDLIVLIIGDAFTAQAGFGAAIGWGIKRGVYSNEAGIGTGAHASSAAEVEHPAQQGLVQAFSVYIDTLLVCSATAFMILITQQYNIQGSLPDGQFLVQHVDGTIAIGSPVFTQLAVSSIFGDFGQTFVAAAIFLFAFTSIMAFCYIAETNTAYLTRFVPRGHKVFNLIVKMCIMLMIVYGSLNSSAYIWNIGDIGIGLMAWLNIVGILLTFIVGSPALKALKDYDNQYKAQQGNTKKIYYFKPRVLGINNATFWEEKPNKSTLGK